jgi:hypothetical protein
MSKVLKLSEISVSLRIFPSWAITLKYEPIDIIATAVRTIERYNW